MSDLALRNQFTEISNLVERLELETQVEPGSMKTDVLSIMENILRAETAEEIFAQQEAGTISSQDYVGRVFYLNKEGIEWKKTAAAYREQGAFPFYALLRVIDDNGNEIVITCGAASCVAVLDKLVRTGYLDDDKALMFAEKPVSSGFSVILLRPVPVANRESKKSAKD